MDKQSKAATAAQTFESELGYKATIQRENISSALATEMNAKLHEIGEKFKFTDKIDYLGSGAVHIFQAPALGQMFFVCQTQTLRETAEPVAGAAMSELRKQMMLFYGRNPGKLRSGF